MQEIYTEFIKKILQNKKKLEKELEVKISNKGKVISINGKGDKEYIACQAIEAINLGFSVDRALLLKDESMILQTLNIKDLTRRKNWEEIRSRIIGTHGRTLKTLNNLTNCNISLHENKLGIIGDCEEIEDAIQALTSLVQGSKQGKVYGRIERERKNKRLRGKLNLSEDIV